MGGPGCGEERLQAAIGLALAGMSYRQAAAETGAASATIANRVRAGGLVRRVEPKVGRPRLSDAVVRPALAAVARGVRVADAAAAAGMHASTLRDRVRDHGVVMLRGNLPNGDAVAHVKDLAQKVEGVKSVDTSELRPTA